MQATPIAFAATGSDIRRRARRGLAIYFAIVVVLSAPIEAGIIITHAVDNLIASLIWLTGWAAVPTIASVVARLALKEGFSDVSFRLGGRRGRNAVLQTPILPVVVGVLTYGIAWASGLLAHFGSPSPEIGGWGLWAILFAVAIPVNIIDDSGEEIGWRGYALTRLIDSGVPRPVLASGVIWGLWHAPLYLWGGFAVGQPPLLATALLLVVTTAFGYVLARVRLETGSIWPAIALHVAWNVIIQIGFDELASGPSKAVWVGETGIITSLVLVVVVVIYSRGRWTIFREPPKPEMAYAQQEGVRAQSRAH
ncbi:MAG: CPBP family intramembrane metalloprotease [Chloroflexota bacterium]|nr:CPBP family intramembrane metalloprotease [Chloroflexota bacterium]